MALSPLCSDFDNTVYTQYFSNLELSKNEDPAYGWTLLTASMLTYLDNWRVKYGQPMTINSAYRNPYHNFHLSQGRQGAYNSRHMFGDAVDIANPTRDLGGRDALIRALAPKGDPTFRDYLEPISGPCGMGCVHADWRNHLQTYAHTLIADINFQLNAVFGFLNRIVESPTASTGAKFWEVRK